MIKLVLTLNDLFKVSYDNMDDFKKKKIKKKNAEGQFKNLPQQVKYVNVKIFQPKCLM